jgi:ketosteroid isomerase-like protein
MSNADDVRAIELAKTEYREGYNTGDVTRVMNVFADAFIDLSAGQPGFYGMEARVALQQRLTDLFHEFDVRMFVIIAYVHTAGDFANDWGWHKIWLFPKRGGSPRYVKLRYTENWIKVKGEWKIALFMSAVDQRPELIPKRESSVLAEVATEKPAPKFPPQVGASGAH